MLESSQQWQLFGYDMRNIGGHWVAAWRDLLWGDDSPVRRQLDEAVSLHTENGTVCYQAGSPCALAAPACSAYLLPDDLVLSKCLSVPLAVEGDLESVMALEVNANSPFAADDTAYGWRIIRRDESQLQVLLVIVSMSSVMAYLGRRFDAHDARRQEVWAQIDGAMVVVRGFGEELRERRYAKRLLRTTIMLSVIAVLLLSIVAVATGLKGVGLQRVQVMAATTQRESADASRMRSSLVAANETIAAVNQIVMKYPNPQVEIARLTHLLGDEVSVERFSMQGLEIDLRGRAVDAASVMQRLTDQPDYAEVAAPRAITRVRGTQLEQFYLSIRRREGASP